MKKAATAKALALVTVLVFGWSVVMAAMGHAALIAVAAPVLGLTVTQVLHGARRQTTPVSRDRVEAVPDEGDGTP
ncbi:hypothetical protein RGF97_33180 [Streptomyces roseicoloratus]|uniref:Lipoprotein n=2 Tax=Streptomyces roseicoloratus TaxID=2508722 RepID=A0ABY9S482_9ACTN|nr:hypothetical protein [Streptomyces roseicoloratus]WMX48693.1 hypothetical protein RGF97_00095 [Streptomyces roseicoloratus]WMX49130.1 hypothetical protein RGF97_33180 [Streptomyces roseicoloratus]